MNKLLIIVIFLFSLPVFSKKLEKVSLQLHWKYQFEFAGFIAAKEKGFYKDVGLDVELKEFNDDIDVINEVLRGKSNYGVYNSSILLEYLKGKPIKLFASFFKRSAMILVVKPEIKSPKDLIGKTVMTSGEFKDFILMFKYMFWTQGVNIKNLILVKPSYNIDGFVNGDIDALSSFISDEPYKLDKLGVKYNILDPSDYGIYNLFMELFTSEKEARNHFNRTKLFKEASIKGWEYALENKDEIIGIIREKYRPDLSVDILENESMKIEKLILPFAYEVGSINKNFFKKQIKQVMKYYNIKNKRSLKDFIFVNQKEIKIIDYTLFLKVLLVFIFIFLVILLKQKQLKKYNKKLQLINKELKLNKIELLNQYNYNKKLMETLENKIRKEVKKSREKDKQMIQQSRLAQMGEMISMIAHQWRQPLASISNLSNALNIKAQLNVLDNDLIIKYSNEIQQYTQHLSLTIDDFKNFFKPNKEKEKTSYNEIIESALSIIETSIINKNIKIIKNLSSESYFMTYKNEVKQVVLNLIKNAEDILLEKKIKEPIISITTKEEHGNYILEVSDNGGGISEDIIDKIFDPYFSTKSSKNGTGLGLYMAKLIIEEHCNGKITVRNEVTKNCSNENKYFIIKGYSNTIVIFKIIL